VWENKEASMEYYCQNYKNWITFTQVTAKNVIHYYFGDMVYIPF